MSEPSDLDIRTGQAYTWTSGEFIGEGQGTGLRTDIGAYDARQWLCEGQGEPDATPRRNLNTSASDNTTKQ